MHSAQVIIPVFAIASHRTHALTRDFATRERDERRSNSGRAKVGQFAVGWANSRSNRRKRGSVRWLG